MWRFKPFSGKEPTGLEGRMIDVGTTKIQVRTTIAEGGFSCVYLARDVASPTKQYALKHMICQDQDSLELAMKEIAVLKRLRGHPNVVALVADAILDLGRTKEAMLVMELCEKSLVAVLENRGVGYFEEKQVLLIFRDVCSAVFSMHRLSPPVAHRDLKAENVLLGSDGAWKLCDFGSTSTNHKCFDRPEEMGIEEDNIRKYTTPAYRAPEMWDLYRREVISEKVDIWALGCLLYRICYFKLVFDGESKLQILNGNYRIPELPKYSDLLTNLIKVMLESSPDARPDITQVWFRVNALLPAELQKHMPNGSSSASAASAFDVHPPSSDTHDEGGPRRSSVMPRRSPPPPPSSREKIQNISPQSDKEVPQQTRSSRSIPVANSRGGGSLGAFWSTQHAHDSLVAEDNSPKFDDEPTSQITSKHDHSNPERRQSLHGNTLKGLDESLTNDFEIHFSPEKSLHADIKQSSQNEAVNAFIANFDSATNISKSSRSKEEILEAEVARLKEQLRHTNTEKTEIASKYEKLSAICRSQRQELQELKQALAASTPSPQRKDNPRMPQVLAASTPSPPSKDNPRTPEVPQREKIEGTMWELQQGMFTNNYSASPSPESKQWQPFAVEPKPQATPTPRDGNTKSVRTVNGHRNSIKQSPASPSTIGWEFDPDSFKAESSVSPAISRGSTEGVASQRFGGVEAKKTEPNQPAGWAGF